MLASASFRSKGSLLRLANQQTVRRFSLTQSRNRWDKLVFHPEVEQALAERKPVVALETAILTHGMPYPLNLDVTLSLSKIIRDAGAVPATIALLHGVPTVGLTHSELQRLADPEFEAVKVSRRDLAPAMAFGKDGGTTVAGTMWFARQAGIDVFVTGGIGGVHRDGENSLDVSADLTELGRTPLAVICAGCKSILDIGRTIEYLETQGVTVATLGKTNDFPAFYTPKSGFKSPWSMETAQEAARMIHTGLTLPTPLASLITVPIPEEWAPAGEEVQKHVEQAVRESVEAGVRGKEATPWLLARVAELTQGSSVKSNIALIQNNAKVGAEIAVHLAALKRGEDVPAAAKTYTTGHVITPSKATSSLQGVVPASTTTPTLPFPTLIVVGSAAIDITTRPTSLPILGSETTVPGSVDLTPGGVGLNVALCASRLVEGGSDRVMLIAPRGRDAFGRVLEGEMEGLGLRADGLVWGEGRTAVCSLVLDGQGSLEGGVADMEIVENLQGSEIVDKITHNKPSLVALDGNLSPETLTLLLKHCASLSIPTLFEPTSLPKSTRLLPYLLSPASSSVPKVDYITPNLLELREIYRKLDGKGAFESQGWWDEVEGLGLGEEWRNGLERWARRTGLDDLVKEGVVHMLTSLSPFFPTQLVKLGSRGCLSLRVLPSSPLSSPPSHHTLTHARLTLTYHPSTSLPEGEEVNTTGAGDSLVGAVLAGLVSDTLEVRWERVVERGQQAARASLASRKAVGEVGGSGWEL